MAVEQQGEPELGLGLGEQPLQRAVVGPVGAIDPALGLGEAQTRAVDGAPRDAARDRAQARPCLGRAEIYELRELIGKEIGIEFEGIAVGIDVRPGEARPEQRRAERRGAVEEAIDAAVLEPAQLRRRDRKLLQQAGRLDIAAVRR